MGWTHRQNDGQLLDQKDDGVDPTHAQEKKRQTEDKMEGRPHPSPRVDMAKTTEDRQQWMRSREGFLLRKWC